MSSWGLPWSSCNRVADVFSQLGPTEVCMSCRRAHWRRPSPLSAGRDRSFESKLLGLTLGLVLSPSVGSGRTMVVELISDIIMGENGKGVRLQGKLAPSPHKCVPLQSLTHACCSLFLRVIDPMDTHTPLHGPCMRLSVSLTDKNTAQLCTCSKYSVSVCTSVCIHVCYTQYVYLYIHTHVYICIYTHVCAPYVYVCTRMRMCECPHVST
mmetsp:Transcript_22770/g.56198  ORF Transcript_22770/g.56198 Transcript_22770/m.56198 type:complete len:210 (-) Transcript_22770:1531-2160(-)